MKSTFYLLALIFFAACQPKENNNPNSSANTTTTASSTNQPAPNAASPNLPNKAIFTEYKAKCGEWGENVYFELTGFDVQGAENQLNSLKKLLETVFFPEYRPRPKGSLKEAFDKITKGDLNDYFCQAQTILYNNRGLLSVETHQYTDMEPVSYNTYDLHSGKELEIADIFADKKQVENYIASKDTEFKKFKKMHPKLGLELSGEWYLNQNNENTVFVSWTYEQSQIGDAEVCGADDCWNTIKIPAVDLSPLISANSPLQRLLK